MTTKRFSSVVMFLATAVLVAPGAHAQQQTLTPAPLEPSASSPERSEPPPRDEPPVHTLFSGKVDHGGYGAPAMKLTSVDGEPAALVGAQGGWIIGHSLVLGLAGYGLATRQETPELMRVQGVPSTLEMGYGGLRVGYLIAPASLVHLGIGLLVGGGGVAALSREKLLGVDDGEPDYSYRTGSSDAFFVTEPELEAELNFTKFMRVALSGSYRVVAGIEAPGLRASKIGGPAAGLALRFGSF